MTTAIEPASFLCHAGVLNGKIDDDRVEAMKQQFAERAVAKAVKQRAPETFDPNTSVSLRVDSDRDLSLL